jgi:hypothetical protein
MFHSRVLLILMIIYLTGCSSNIKNSATPNQAPKDTLKKTRITQYEELSPFWKQTNGDGDIYLDAYTSLIITSPDHDVQICEDGIPCEVEDYLMNSGAGETPTLRPYLSRNWFQRIWNDVVISTSLTFELTTPDYSTTVPLAIMEYSSSRETGDQWYRMVAIRREAFPLFLIKQNGQNSKAGFKFNVHKSQQSKSNAGQLLKTTIDTLSTVSPQLTVVTSLNKHFTESSKEAIDKTLSSNFNKSITEDLVRDVSLMEISHGSNIQVEFGNQTTDKDFVDTYPKTIGRWQITFDYPRPSVFSAFRICPQPESKSSKKKTIFTYKNGCRKNRSEAEKAVLESVKASEILNFSLAFGSDDVRNFGTINSFLRQQDWFAEFLELDKNAVVQSVDKLCKNIRNSIVGVNLNSFDADLVVYAVIANMPFKMDTSNALTDRASAAAINGVPNSCSTNKGRIDTTK